MNLTENVESRRFVIVESPYAGTTAKEINLNLRYLRLCMNDCIMRGEVPYASHGLYTQRGVLRDNVPGDRKLGMNCGFAVRERFDFSAFYTDLNLSSGMDDGVADGDSKSFPKEYRKLFPELTDMEAIRAEIIKRTTFPADHYPGWDDSVWDVSEPKKPHYCQACNHPNNCEYSTRN